MSQPRYTVIIQWSEEEQRYVVSLPEWGDLCKTHGQTYEEAAKNAREVLELLLDGEATPPNPKLFHYPGADVVNLPDRPQQTNAQSAVA
jgi:predicted RNase H-like HicB family nuclease